MPSAFAGAQSWQGSFRADQLTMRFDGNSVEGFLIQNVQFTFSQQVTMIYEIGSSYVYYVGGRSQGTATLMRVVGPQPLAADFINRYNDICDPQPIELDASAGCPNTVSYTSGIVYSLEEAVLTSISVSVTSQNVVINEQLQFMFIDLESPTFDGGGEA